MLRSDAYFYKRSRKSSLQVCLPILLELRLFEQAYACLRLVSISGMRSSCSNMAAIPSWFFSELLPRPFNFKLAKIREFYGGYLRNTEF
jgi:hypothetical protein